MKLAVLALCAATHLLLSGCATGVAGSPRRICYNSGLQPGTAEFSQCWKGVRKEQFARDGQMIEGALPIAASIVVAVSTAKNIAEAKATARAGDNASSTISSNQTSSWPPRVSQPSTTPQTTSLCPNGQYVFGVCTRAPNGTYVSGRPQLAPDGTYVSGTPRLAPDGRYVGGDGPLKLCPDGRYVSGSYCQLMPNGQYIGQP